MFVKALKRWRSIRPGTIWDHPDGAARLLIKRGIAEVHVVKPSVNSPRKRTVKK